MSNVPSLFHAAVAITHISCRILYMYFLASVSGRDAWVALLFAFGFTAYRLCHPFSDGKLKTKSKQLRHNRAGFALKNTFSKHSTTTRWGTVNMNNTNATCYNDWPLHCKE
jgi:hypothetical protein